MFSDLAEFSAKPTPLATAKATARGEGVVGEYFSKLSKRVGEGMARPLPQPYISLHVIICLIYFIYLFVI